MKKTKEELEAECKKLQKLDRWYGLLIVSGALIILFGFFVLDNIDIALIGIIPAVIAVIFLTPKFHCPFCGSYLRMKFGLPNNCPFCGEKLTGRKPEDE